MYVCTFVHPVVNFTAQPEDTKVCKGSDVTINCGYSLAIARRTTWFINGTLFTPEELLDSPLYQLNDPFMPRIHSLTVFSINGTTTFQCVVASDPTITSTVGTVTVIGMYAHIMYACTYVLTVGNCMCLRTLSLNDYSASYSTCVRMYSLYFTSMNSVQKGHFLS